MVQKEVGLRNIEKLMSNIDILNILIYQNTDISIYKNFVIMIIDILLRCNVDISKIRCR